MPAPRLVRQAPFVKTQGPTVWTTLALTIYADGSTGHELVGASSFPRHWIYDVSYLAADLSPDDLRELATGHHREDEQPWPGGSSSSTPTTRAT